MPLRGVNADRDEQMGHKWPLSLKNDEHIEQ